MDKCFLNIIIDHVCLYRFYSHSEAFGVPLLSVAVSLSKLYITDILTAVIVSHNILECRYSNLEILIDCLWRERERCSGCFYHHSTRESISHVNGKCVTYGGKAKYF